MTEFYDIYEKYVSENCDMFVTDKLKCSQFHEEPFLVDSSLKYYLLGFLCNSQSKLGDNCISISVKHNDISLINDIQFIIKSNIDINNMGEYLVLNLFSKNIYNEYLSFSKDRYMCLKDKIPEEYYIDFLRGMFDKNGSINENCIVLNVSLDNIFVNSVNVIYNKLGINPIIHEYNRQLYISYLDKPAGLKCLASLYRKKSLHLPSKYEKFINLVRPSPDELLMEMAHMVRLRSTCIRSKVGCVIANTNKTNVLSIGYNGGFRNGPNHCQSSLDGLCGCIHAESNALIKNNGPYLYCTTQPCSQCSKQIINAGVKEVFFSEPYRKDCSNLFDMAGVKHSLLKRNEYKWKFEIMEGLDNNI